MRSQSPSNSLARDTSPAPGIDQDCVSDQANRYPEAKPTADKDGPSKSTRLLHLPSAVDWYSFRHSWSYRVGKRMLDLVLVFALLPVLLPICLLLMLLIRWSSKGPIFYRHLRVGQDSRGFHLYKFRTMFINSDAILAAYLATDPDARQEWDKHYKLRRDPRVTPLGAMLRRTSLDELPQILNVLLGHMSFVGPRPIVHDEICRYGGAFAFYAAAKPGITGLWQVSGRGMLPYETRVSLDIKYVMTWSFLHDMRVLLKTARVVCNSEGAY
jgi:lipopolysaccharide/colanic/teichoic acid biosynthesis glycosyltransferase